MPEATPGKIKQLLATSEPAELGPKARSASQPLPVLNASLGRTFRETNLSAEAQQLVRSLILLWHDHLDASHEVSQGIETPDGSLVHAIMHRREPDYWNSKYWWRQVGKHPCFPEIARRVLDFLKPKAEDTLAAKLVPGGQWDPFAFVDACEAAAGWPTTDNQVQLLRTIQRIETEVALEHFVGNEVR